MPGRSPAQLPDALTAFAECFSPQTYSMSASAWRQQLSHRGHFAKRGDHSAGSRQNNEYPFYTAMELQCVGFGPAEFQRSDNAVFVQGVLLTYLVDFCNVSIRKFNDGSIPPT
jgi:hypothetical protein